MESKRIYIYVYFFYYILNSLIGNWFVLHSYSHLMPWIWCFECNIFLFNYNIVTTKWSMLLIDFKYILAREMNSREYIRNQIHLELNMMVYKKNTLSFLLMISLNVLEWNTIDVLLNTDILFLHIYNSKSTWNLNGYTFMYILFYYISN